MLDGVMRRVIDPGLNAAGRALSKRGVGADAVTLAGLALGLAGAGVIWAAGPWWAALTLVLASRLLDGLDGAVARARGKTDFGGYLDIVCDFAFYAAIPLAFGLRDPDQNGAAAAFLLASFYINGATFLGYAVLAEKRGMQTDGRGEKSLYFTAGLLEGTETIVFFALLCLFADGFVPLAAIFGTLCLVTALARVGMAARVFRAGAAPAATDPQIPL
ncbi:CDP-alcohol phosphatidyltransferase family protein [Paragemmobacter straminiformis]|uniref:CDP-alcohol phosphatidyltransferase family protein n=1 Tax=Paragemmobacter straminiformis TaxID=2045119 RepID=A0A842I683_9RHOB|nr:CDP-alcohol phosphatidyltransferase family protein [Gemmobacter straminiformis]MBC2835169.1 CDP-alcohol phosphatidyltransferase family protein [Gemmobacter straminiformis]